MKSLMFVPCRPKMLAKIPGSDADAVIIDLEDSVNEADKEQALDDACAFLSAPCDKKIYIRTDEKHLKEELEKLSAYSFAGYMLPKFENPDAYCAYTSYFDGREIIALVETPAGIINLREIASCSFVSMIAFGAEDFTSCAGMKNCPETLVYARSAIVTYGKAFGKPVYDTPSFIIDSPEALEAEIQIAVDMGFDGKLAIHPNQVKSINRMFEYYDLEKMREIVSLYEVSGEAVLRTDSGIYEKMHIAHFKRILKEHGIN